MYNIILQTSPNRVKTARFLHKLGLSTKDLVKIIKSVESGIETTIMETNDLKLAHSTIKKLYEIECAGIIREIN